MADCNRDREVADHVNKKIANVLSQRGLTYWERMKALEDIKPLILAWKVSMCKECCYREKC